MDIEPTPEKEPNRPLTEVELRASNIFLKKLGLTDVADRVITMHDDLTGTVAYGLGRCYEDFAHRDPDEIKALILFKIAEQDQAASATDPQ